MRTESKLHICDDIFEGICGYLCELEPAHDESAECSGGRTPDNVSVQFCRVRVRAIVLQFEFYFIKLNQL